MRLSARHYFDAIARSSGISFLVELPGHRRYAAGEGEPAFSLRFGNWRAILRVLARAHIGLIEGYFDRQIDIDGSFRAALACGMSAHFDRRANPVNRFENWWLERKNSNRTPERAKRNARAHYALGADSYRLWLDDPYMMYTCGYWPEGTTTLEQAQRNKIDHVCRKIRLSPGDRYIDIGCGFGGFMFRAWERCRALGTGLNTTTEQVDWLREQIARRGLAGHLEVREADFREVDRPYDKVVSIGVLEHAGRDQIASVVKAHADFLRPGGLGMLHFIGHQGPHETELFIRKHVFPGGWIPSLAQVVREMERNGLEMVDIENLRRHYALTLDAWAERFDRHWDEIRRIDPERFDERFRRIWRTYLIGCAEMFRQPTGYTNLFQIVFSKGNVTRHGYPMDRGFLYREPAATELPPDSLPDRACASASAPAPQARLPANA